MHLVVLNQFYWPSIAATAQLLTDLCEAVAARGHEVTVVCGQGDYLGGERLAGREERNGVRILRVPATGFGKGTLPGRLSDYASFYALASAELMRVPAPDVVMAMSTPPLIALAGLTAARARRARFVYWCQDVYPDVAVALGAIREGGGIARALDDASRQVLERADAIVAIGEEMARVLAERGAERIEVIHNWADGRAIDPGADGPERDEVRRELGADRDDLLVLYAGNMGRAHDFRAVEAVMSQLAQPALERIRLGFVGDGARKPELVAAAEQAGVLGSQVEFLPYQPRERLGTLLCAADAHLICLDPAAAGLVVPSKLYGTMASGRPTLLLGPSASEPAEILRRVGAGERIDPDDQPGLVNAFRRLIDEPERRQVQGDRARQGFLAGFDKRAATTRFVEVLERGQTGRGGAKTPPTETAGTWSRSASPF
jgi:glycosyltransferase involved in cell wall biosynthesis